MPKSSSSFFEDFQSHNVQAESRFVQFMEGSTLGLHSALRQNRRLIKIVWGDGENRRGVATWTNKRNNAR